MHFLIEKNSHYANFTWPRIIWSKVLEGTFSLKEDFSYNILLQKDTNKLIGLSDGWHHHNNSIRLGFRWNEREEKTEIMLIRYMNGKRTIVHLCFIKEGSINYYKIVIRKSCYEITLNERKVSIIRESKWFLPCILLKPYFGGITIAPKDFNFEITINE